MTDAPHDLAPSDGRHVHQDRRWRRSRHVPLPTQRKKLEAAVEAALAAVEAAVVELDALDGDPDLEDGGDLEPSLAFTTGVWRGTDDDRELDPGEEEPLLGWTERASITGRLGVGADDAEPSLGATDAIDQRRWGGHRVSEHTDLEEQCEDEGAGDDREPDQDGDGTPERSWQIGGREAYLIDGANRSWAERQGSDRQNAELIDPDDAPDPLQPPRYGWACSR